MRWLAHSPPSPFIDGPKSVLSTAHAKHRCGRIPKVRQTARAAASSLSGTLADCARQPAHSHRRFSMVENRSYRPPTPTCMQRIGVAGYPRSGKRPAPPRHRAPALSQTVRGHGDAALTRRIAPSRSARLGSSPILKSDYRRRSSTPCVRLRGCLRACVCVYAIAVGCPSFTLSQGTKHGRTFREIDGRTLLAPALTSCRAPGVLMVRRLFLAMQLRKVSGERNTVPERIPRSVSGSRT